MKIIIQRPNALATFRPGVLKHILLILILTEFLGISCNAQETNAAAILSHPPDKFKVSYALGLRLGLQLKRADADVDADAIAQAIKDVMAGRPTKIQEADIQSLFDEANAYGLAKQGEENKKTGAAFLTKNATEPGVIVLPDGLQYHVIEAGAGETPKSNDLVIVNETLLKVDGTLAATNYNHMLSVRREARGCQEALQMMKVGAKWELFIPASLAYGHQAVPGMGPDATLVLELELLSIEPPITGIGEPANAVSPGNVSGNERDNGKTKAGNIE